MFATWEKNKEEERMILEKILLQLLTRKFHNPNGISGIYLEIFYGQELKCIVCSIAVVARSVAGRKRTSI